MSVLDSVLCCVGLYLPLRKIVHAYAWETHIEDEWKRQLQTALLRIEYLTHGLWIERSPKSLWAAVRCIDQRDSMIIRGRDGLGNQDILALSELICNSLRITYLVSYGFYRSRDGRTELFWGNEPFHLPVPGRQIIWFQLTSFHRPALKIVQL